MPTPTASPIARPAPTRRYRPVLSNAGLKPAHAVVAVDEFGEPREGHIAGEQPLTLYIDKREVVTLMTLGTHPELLVLGYLRNQRLVPSLDAVRSVQVDWEADACAVTTFDGIGDLDEKLKHRTVTSGCGQGTVFGRISDWLDQLRLPSVRLTQSRIYALLDTLSAHNEVYRRAGAVHGCALCSGNETGRGGDDIELFVEDVGRHNAADAISGHMWLNDIDGADKVFYTTGRLTSEMVIKIAQMGIPVLLSRSGVTQKGLEFAKKIGVVMIARAKGSHFLIYNGAERVDFDAKPERAPGRQSGIRSALGSARGVRGNARDESLQSGVDV
ncbi:MAG: formate dehydrogenase accessory sulfurtransferase FdhD [Thiohalocapsa sp.]